MDKKLFINQVNSFYVLAWSLTKSISSLLDQTGIPAHRVFSESVIDHYFFFINNPPRNDGKIILIKENIIKYIDELIVLNTKIISSVDDVVIKSLAVDNQENKQAGIFPKFFNSRKWSDCASVRFNRVICPVYEEILCKN
ncbi:MULTISPECIES: hypothetical protein [unclassified Pseudoalteromonas]|uniref:hypothetical protein n=1 Tax=unclassified Pseudoalteromonas TaxID=194690 RepID=UPI0018F30B9C|nr:MULTISPECIES: hypothetical protein [unclassified Pseudoalteromonas]MCC9660239.1 hypothetical protein [Pseudoalteromonas sp. MB41]